MYLSKIASLDFINSSSVVYPETWPVSTVQYIMLAFFLCLASTIYNLQKKKQTCANAPIAGIAEGESSRSARERFRIDAKEMIRDGYNRVGISIQCIP